VTLLITSGNDFPVRLLPKVVRITFRIKKTLGCYYI